MSLLEDLVKDTVLTEAASGGDVVIAAEKEGRAFAKAGIKLAKERMQQAAMDLSYNNIMASSKLTELGFAYQAFTTYSKTGRFVDLSVGNFQAVSLRTRYLESIGKQGHNNIDAEYIFNELVKQNGPSKMKKRLVNYIKKHVKDMTK